LRRACNRHSQFVAQDQATPTHQSHRRQTRRAARSPTFHPKARTHPLARHRPAQGSSPATRGVPSCRSQLLWTTRARQQNQRPRGGVVGAPHASSRGNFCRWQYQIGTQRRRKVLERIQQTVRRRVGEMSIKGGSSSSQCSECDVESSLTKQRHSLLPSPPTPRHPRHAQPTKRANDHGQPLCVGRWVVQ
jgi:hypothetical protein